MMMDKILRMESIIMQGGETPYTQRDRDREAKRAQNGQRDDENSETDDDEAGEMTTHRGE